MPEFHLTSHHLCPYVQRAVIVLSEKNIPHRRTYIDLSAKPDWFNKISPLGKVPVLQTGGSVLFESQVIAEYLDEITPGSLHPENPLEKARHRSWIEFASQTPNAIGGFYSAPDAQSFSQKQSALKSHFARIEPEVASVYFAGGSFRMIDGVWGTVFRYLDVFDQIGDFGLLSDLPTVRIWRKNVSARASVAKAPPEGYSDRLLQFLVRRNSHLSTLIG